MNSEDSPTASGMSSIAGVEAPFEAPLVSAIFFLAVSIAAESPRTVPV
jgi:hypothetical protein